MRSGPVTGGNCINEVAKAITDHQAVIPECHVLSLIQRVLPSHHKPSPEVR